METPTSQAPAPGTLTALCRRIEEGDGTAEAELVDRFRRGLGLMLRRIAPTPDLADDLLQQTFWLVLQKVRSRQVLDPERLPGFIRSTARNLLIADRRKEGRWVTAGDGDDLEATHDRAVARAGRPDPGPLQAALRREEARLVRMLLAELPMARDRQMLFRYYLDNEPKAEICRDLGLDPERFHRVLHRARERLKELWRGAEKRERLRRARL